MTLHACNKACSAQPQPQVKGFNLVELMVVLAIVGILAGLLLPSLARSRERAKRVQCVNNLKQIVAATIMYAEDDSQGRFTPHEYRLWPTTPHNWVWRFLNRPAPQLFICPSTDNRIAGAAVTDKSTGKLFYADLIGAALNRFSEAGHSYNAIPFFADYENYWNGNYGFKDNARGIPKTVSSVNGYSHLHEAFNLEGTAPGPANVWLYSDNDAMRSRTAFFPDPDNNHGAEGMNAALVDGHVEWLKRDAVIFRHELSQDNNRTRAYPR